MKIANWIEKFNAGVKKLIKNKHFKDNFPLFLALFDNIQFNDTEF